MTMLWPTLPFDPQETLISYADRLAMYHTGRGMERLLRDHGIHHEHFVSGRPEAVAGFADATGHALIDVQRNAIRVFQRGGEFRGEATSKPFLPPQTRRYCSACLDQDCGPTDWRFRLIWDFRPVQRCDLHGVWLEPTANTTKTCLRVALNETSLAAPSEIMYETPTYLDWLHGRLQGGDTTETPWLADHTLEQVLAASEIIGGVLQHGHKVKLTKLSPAETEEATDIGFSIYSEGPEAVEEALDTIRQTSPANAVQAGPLAHYGKLFDWLDRRSNSNNPGPIRDLLRDHIVKHSAVEPGTTVLGVEIAERRYHTLYSLASAVGIDRPRLSRLLKKLGEIPPDATEVECGNMVFDAATAVPMVEAFETAIPLRDVPDYLGASKRQLEILYREGIVLPLVPRSGRGSVRNVVFGRSHLDEMLEVIARLPEIEVSSEGDFHPISYASQCGAGRSVRTPLRRNSRRKDPGIPKSRPDRNRIHRCRRRLPGRREIRRLNTYRRSGDQARFGGLFLFNFLDFARSSPDFRDIFAPRSEWARLSHCNHDVFRATRRQLCPDLQRLCKSSTSSHRFDTSSHQDLHMGCPVGAFSISRLVHSGRCRIAWALLRKPRLRRISSAPIGVMLVDGFVAKMHMIGPVCSQAAVLFAVWDLTKDV